MLVCAGSNGIRFRCTLRLNPAQTDKHLDEDPHILALLVESLGNLMDVSHPDGCVQVPLGGPPVSFKGI